MSRWVDMIVIVLIALGAAAVGAVVVLNATNGQRLWGQKIGGAIGGGVITYTANGVQKIAVTTGFVSPRLAR
jgi:outer membrane protein assembly factor BamB